MLKKFAKECEEKEYPFLDWELISLYRNDFDLDTWRMFFIDKAGKQHFCCFRSIELELAPIKVIDYFRAQLEQKLHECLRIAVEVMLKEIEAERIQGVGDD